MNRWIDHMIEQTRYEMYDSGDWYWLKKSITDDSIPFDFYFERIMSDLNRTEKNIKDMNQIIK